MLHFTTLQCIHLLFNSSESDLVAEYEDYLTVETVARMFRVIPRTILNWIHSGAIPENLVARKGPGTRSPFLIHISAINVLESDFGLIADFDAMDNNRD